MASLQLSPIKQEHYALIKTQKRADVMWISSDFTAPAEVHQLAELHLPRLSFHRRSFDRNTVI